MYVIKWTNGFWKVFSTVEWKDVAIYETYKAAVEDLARNT